MKGRDVSYFTFCGVVGEHDNDSERVVNYMGARPTFDKAEKEALDWFDECERDGVADKAWAQVATVEDGHLVLVKRYRHEQTKWAGVATANVEPNSVRERIIGALKARSKGLTRSDLFDLFDRHLSAAEIDRALNHMIVRGQIETERENTRGRPRTVVRLVSAR